MSFWESYLSRFIKAGSGVENIVGLKKNLAYNLQYLQFQRQVLHEFEVTQVILTQTWKINIIVGTSIIEAFLYYLIVSKNLQKTNKWEKVGSTSNETNMQGEKVRIENIIFKELDIPLSVDMTLDVMIKKAESKKLLGKDREIYKQLNYLRNLRNRVHLHAISEDYDTDWRKIGKNEVDTVRTVLYIFLTSSLFKPTAEQKSHLEFLWITT